MVISIPETVPGVRGPTATEFAWSCLEADVHDADKHIVQFKVCWPSTGVTIMTDDEVGHENVVQLVIDNAENYRKAGLLLMERRPNLYWIPCAAHYVNLMLKETGKLRRVKTCILKSKLITRFIYNHKFLHALMREHYMREIVRESTTRLATTFLTIQSLLINKAGLRLMICSNEWQTDRAAMSQLGRQVEITLLDRRFWARCNNVVSVNEPLLRVLRLSDFDDKPAMGWRDQLHRDIHAAGFFLNLQNLYPNATLDDEDIMEGVKNYIYRLELDIETQMECMQQMLQHPMEETWQWTWMTIYTQDENETEDDEEIDGTMKNTWLEPVIQECEGTQHHAVFDEQQDLMRLIGRKSRHQGVKVTRQGRDEAVAVIVTGLFMMIITLKLLRAITQNRVGVTQNKGGESMKVGRI
ncbi:uncharacterized protein LOC105421276 [Amborella trichopoda]|uniref:uncharacterized protein LOC105421276 n=1 Tax=Amborella trichopoda TaxID=13333 RepID=UPI0005D3FE11|nr:uncharacterized protein LOC105421276 [Amborella trichopoda]|eukprot:XP_011626359.1 uncharacterized protein LOC105421276 [Amborella trichopoda]